MYSYYYNSGNQSLALIYANMTARVVVKVVNTLIWRNLVLAATEVVTIGSYVQKGLCGQRFSASNFSALGSFLYSSVYNGQLIAATYSSTVNVVYATGFNDGPISNLPCRQSAGSIITLKWDLINNTVTCLAAYGGYNGQPGGGIGVDESGTIVVAGLVHSAQGLYGDYDALILMYSANLTLLNAPILGG